MNRLSRKTLRRPGLLALLALLASSAAIGLTSPATASAAAACPIDGCHQPIDPPPPAPPAPKYRVTVYGPSVNKTSEADGDELYIKIKNSVVYGPALMTAGMFPGWYVYRDVTGPVTVSLYDQDASGGDDSLGSWTVPLPASTAWPVTTWHFFTGEGADYQLWVHVRRLS
jgi:hypothetical protein